MTVTVANAVHIPVLLRETLETLGPALALPARKGRPARLLDGTLGLAGHASALLEAATAAGHSVELCGLDRDEQALERAHARLGAKPGIHLFHLPFSRFAEALDELGWDQADAVLLDIGVSSLQLDVAERGFSLHADAPLDMRMDASVPGSARELVNRADFAALKRIITEYGEDPQAGRIARAIVDARQKAPIETTKELADIIWHAYPAKWRATARNHPATRTFQALRMEVNGELEQLSGFLDGILDRLSPGGRLGIISFHSLEDRMVKQRFRLWATDCICPPHVPVCECGHRAEVEVLTRKPLTPADDERNPRAASAKLRVAQKTGEAQ